MERQANVKLSGNFLKSLCAGYLVSAVFVSFLLAAETKIAPADNSIPETVNAASWGFNETDSTDALQAAINSGAKKVIVPYMGKDWIVRPIKFASNQEIYFEPGVVVVAKKGEFKGRDDSLFSVDMKDNVTVHGYGVTFRMHKSDYMDPDKYSKAEWRMTFRIRGSNNVKLLGVTLEESGGDGIYVGAMGDQCYSRDVIIKDVVCDNHYRQGLSVIGAENLLVENCIFKNTAGTGPAAGIDFEPNGEQYKLANCVIRNCVFENNAGGEILFYLIQQTEKTPDISILFDNCYVKSSKADAIVSDGISKVGGKIEFKNCTFEKIAKKGLIISEEISESLKISFTNCKWRNCASHQDLKSKEPKDDKKFEFGSRVIFNNCYLYGEKDKSFFEPKKLESIEDLQRDNLISSKVEDVYRARLGKEDKIRLIVDKVLSYDTRPNMTDGQMKEIAKAGFNVVVPRWGGDDIEVVRQGSLLAQKYGIYYMPWVRASGYTDDDNEKMVWADGTVQSKLYSPNSDQLWEKIESVVLGYAKLSTDIPSLIGTFFDFENYDKEGSRGQCYHLSYDRLIIDKFRDACDINIPELGPTERYHWLESKGYFDEFAAFQINSWKERCKKLRKKIDEINPRFQLAVYPVPGTLFLKEAAFREWSTQQAPIILADPSTYARPMPFFSEEDGLEGNKQKLLDHKKYFQKQNFPFIYIGGIDPYLEGNNPEFCGKNADMIASVSDGYWIFYELYEYTDNHNEFFNWFAKANDSISRDKFSLYKTKRTSPELLGPASIEKKQGYILILVEGVSLQLYEDIKNYDWGKFNLKVDVQWLEGLTQDYIAQSDIIILQASTRLMPFDDKVMRAYVEKGGSLFFTHPGWARRTCMHPDSIAGTPDYTIHAEIPESIFPEITEWVMPKNQYADGICVVDSSLTVAASNPAIGGSPAGTKFQTSSPSHTILKAANGEVLIRNVVGEPVCVVGSYGKGKVAFCGCFYGYTSPFAPYNLSGVERDIFFNLLKWLSQKSSE